jgi:hypothetical protein
MSPEEAREVVREVLEEGLADAATVEKAIAVFVATLEKAPMRPRFRGDVPPKVSAKVTPHRHGGAYFVEVLANGSFVEKFGISQYGVVPVSMSQSRTHDSVIKAIDAATKAAKAVYA